MGFIAESVWGRSDFFVVQMDVSGSVNEIPLDAVFT